MPNYWLVGAMFEGHDDQFHDFIERGYWEFDWDDSDQPEMTSKRSMVQIGDRIAIKKMLGQGATEIEIRAIGEVTRISASSRVLFVKWAVPEMKRKVESKGCFASIHGPYKLDDPNDGYWVRTVFCI